MRLSDGQPLSYLLMLCDELQCWDRASYGQNSRSGIYAYDFDMKFTDEGMRWIYFYDKAYENKVLTAKSYQDMLYKDYIKSLSDEKNRNKFVDDIDEIICVKDVVPAFEPDVKTLDPSKIIEVRIEENRKNRALSV